jgi:hypothetical protein
MKPHPRIRKTVKWGGAAVAVLFLLFWIATSWRWACMTSPWGDELRVDRGYIVYDTTATHQWSFALMPQWDGDGSDKVRVSVRGRKEHVAPYLLAALVVSLVAWYMESFAGRRARVGTCVECGYDRAGLAAGAVCPECGSLPRGS